MISSTPLMTSVPEVMSVLIPLRFSSLEKTENWLVQSEKTGVGIARTGSYTGHGSREVFFLRKVLDMQYNLPDRVFEELCSFAQKYSVNKIILFGSRARGTNTERSDIDIAVYGGDFDGFYWDVKEKIYSLLMFDIVQADTSVSDDLKQEIEKDGVVIYEKA